MVDQQAHRHAAAEGVPDHHRARVGVEERRVVQEGCHVVGEVPQAPGGVHRGRRGVAVPPQVGATTRSVGGRRRTSGSQNSADEQLPWISSTGVPSGGPATRTAWVMPFAVTVRCSVSIRGMLPRVSPSVQVSDRHPAELPGVADRQAISDAWPAARPAVAAASVGRHAGTGRSSAPPDR